MSLVDQIFEQAKLGTAPDPSANPFLQGVALGQHQQALNMELAQLPLKQTLLQQDAQMNSLKIQQGLKARHDDIVNDEAWGGLSGAVTDKLQAGDLPGARSAYIEWNTKTPTLLVDNRSINLGKQLDQMEQRDNAIRVANIRSDASKLRALPAGAKIDNLLLQSQEKLDDELAQDNPDPILVEHYQNEVNSLKARQQIEKDKLKAEQDRIAAEDRRTQATNRRTDLSAPQQARLKSIYKEIDRKKEERDGLPETVGMPWNKQPNPKRITIEKRISELESEAEKLGNSAQPASTPTPDQFEVGKTYVDGQGRKAIYRGDGNWTPVPQ